MVAYSFKAQFEEQISVGLKRQTVRGYRKRHAQPGEPLQLFVAMRTRHCRKILTPDPICLDVRDIKIAHGSYQPLFIELDHRMLERHEVEEFAIADGFGGELADGFAAHRMADFWLKNHGERSFGGVVIRWRPA